MLLVKEISMKIAQLVANHYAVAPNATGAIYSHVAWLTNGLIANKHEVTLFAAEQSETAAKLESVGLMPLIKTSLPPEVRQHYVHSLISKCFQRAADFDIIHSHFNLLSAFYAPLVDTPTVHAIHSPVTPLLLPLLQRFKNQNFISFSKAQQRLIPELNWVGTIYHGVNMKKFSFKQTPQPYVLYLGRVTEDKGVHLAIAAARAAGLQLIIAGQSYSTEGYWHKMIEPYVDGSTVRYVGRADFKKKIEWLQNATALVFPTQAEETFGLAMIEALACGTPVIGWNKGSVSEVVSDGLTGYVVKDLKSMIKAIKQIDRISRKACRERAERLFSVEKMVTGYQRVYSALIHESNKRKRSA